MRLKKVTLLGALDIDGASYRGTNHFANEENFVVCRNNSKSMLRTLHHEFSSLLIWNNRNLFDFKRWIDQNKDGLNSYVLGWQGSSDNAKLGLNGDRLNENLFDSAFLTSYNQTSFENDFNRFSEFLFVLPAELSSLQQHLKIRKKTEQLIEFYNRLGIPVSPLKNRTDL